MWTVEVWKTFRYHQILGLELALKRDEHLARRREGSMSAGLVGKARYSEERVGRGIGGERSTVLGTKYSEPLRPAQRSYMLQIL